MATKRVTNGSVTVEGLVELDRALRGLQNGLAGELRKANLETAREVAADAKSAAYAIGGVAAHAAPSVKASAGRTSAGVAFGGAAHPEAAGAEFGGQRRPTTQQFQPWRGSGPGAGYFVYPTIERDRDEILSNYTEALDRLRKRVFL